MNRNDSFGFGLFPGQYGMAVYSKYPIDVRSGRTFQRFKWKDMPGNAMPVDFYSPEERAALRLSSKSHWDVPIKVNGTIVHFLASHPTPPTFDGPEDRNGRRNHDGIRLVNARTSPSSAGAAEASALQGGANAAHRGDPRFDTADFADTAPGNLRADYILPRVNTKIVRSGVFWPVRSDPLFRLTGVFDPRWSPVNGFPTSDHRLVWADMILSRGRPSRSVPATTPGTWTRRPAGRPTSGTVPGRSAGSG